MPLKEEVCCHALNCEHGYVGIQRLGYSDHSDHQHLGVKAYHLQIHHRQVLRVLLLLDEEVCCHALNCEHGYAGRKTYYEGMTFYIIINIV
jgi:hypothetical protein